MQPLRTAWPADFPPVFIAAGESVVKRHPDYAAAKAGNAEAAARLVSELVTADIVDAIGATLDCRDAIVASIHAVEAGGVNAIPEAVADRIAQQLGLETDENLVQINVVNHTGADGFARLARQALFDGKVRERHRYLIVDDFVGQGGTIANFRGWIESAGAQVVGAVALTGKPHSARLALGTAQLASLRNRHGELEPWWRRRFGFGFDALTQSEARYLERSPDADTIRNRIAAHEQAPSGSGSQGAVEREGKEPAGDSAGGSR